MNSILFCTPCYGNMVFAAHFESCLKLKDALWERGVNHGWLVRGNESLVHRARMGMSKYFLDSDFSHMMWIDADISFEPDDVARLWNMETDIAVGCYRFKSDESRYAAWQNGKLITDLNDMEQRLDHEWAEVDYAGTGFMMLSRKVVETLSSAAPKYENEVEEIPAIYMTPIVNGVLESEDYHFCRIARDAGFKVIMNPKVQLTHWGVKGYGAS